MGWRLLAERRQMGWHAFMDSLHTAAANSAKSRAQQALCEWAWEASQARRARAKVQRHLREQGERRLQRCFMVWGAYLAALRAAPHADAFNVPRNPSVSACSPFNDC